MNPFKNNFLYLTGLSLIINIGASCQLSNLTNVFKLMGSSDTLMPFLWLIPPLAGIIMQPLVGYLSDKTTTAIGRRTPYIVGWGLFAAITFIALPLYSSLLYVSLCNFIIGCSVNGATEGVRALAADSYHEKDIRAQVFSILAFISTLGGVIGAYLPIAIRHVDPFIYITWLNGTIPYNLACSYTLIGGLLFIASFIFLQGVREQKINLPCINVKFLVTSVQSMIRNLKNTKRRIGKANRSFSIILIIHSISWMGIFIFWMYFSVLIAQEHANLLLIDVQHTKNILHHAALKSSFYFSVYQYVSLLFILIIYLTTRYIRLETIHGLALIIGGIGMLLLGIKTSPYNLMAASICIGIMWGSIIVIPYVVILKFLSPNSIGVYLGIFNISITLPQIVCALLLPLIYTQLFHSHAAYALLLAGVFLLLSALLWVLFFFKNQWYAESWFSSMWLKG